MAARIRILRDTALSPAEAWRRLTTWERHGDVVPLTRVTVTTPPPTAAGTVFVARTGVGRRLGFDDPMEVVAWQPPRRCRLEKRGRLVTGWAEFEVRALGCRGGAQVEWREEVRVRGVPAAADPVLAAAGRWMFGRAVDGLLRAE
ncbi:SRPBCC family protein [Streptomyces sp. VRA16 Mangrove soil]|uniref:SRPBCC family protein n=1 Tax=Streptomyces sp. VRA16 Mangrove soil TaxID=2817434 RepID=UPI001A9D2398|nr:SRPBCC family protein [Streptomyces sp. VRA16 Mangrove soil]MBO1331456.1 SRPBCC family protein [Streptomyces sp. VRA16 Mangrove soil]